MPAPFTRFVTFLAVSTAAGAILWWGRLPGPWRRALALVTSAVGVLFLVGALGAEGHREAATTAEVILGPSYVTDLVSASASLRFYVMTGLCLLLGTAGLAVSDEAARRLGGRWMACAIALSLLVTAARFCLEKAAAPASWTRPMGITWLAPVVGAYFAVNLKKEGRGLGSVAGALGLYALAVRGAVALLSVLATTLRLGSHYDVSALVYVKNPVNGRWYEFASGTFEQLFFLTLLPQLVFWPVYTVGSGMLGAALALLVTSRGLGPRLPVVDTRVGMAPAQPER